MQFHIFFFFFTLFVIFCSQPGRGGTSPKPPVPTKESDGKYPTEVPKRDSVAPRDPYFGYESEDEDGDEGGATFFNSFLYSLSLITTVGEENLFLLTPFLISQK